MHSRFRLTVRLGTLIVALILSALPSVGRAAQFSCEVSTSATASPASPPAPAVPEAAFPEDGGSLTVFAAASLVDAFADIETTLEDAHPGLDIVVETAGSQTLVTQLQEGARADVLATANESTMRSAQDERLIEGSPVPFAGNRLVIVAPANNPAGIAGLDDLAGDDVHLVLAGEDVPAGNYAHKAICAFATAGNVDAAFLDNVWANVVSEEQDVRSVLAKVQLGEADVGMVYASDAAAAAQSGSELTVIEFPDSVPTTASYPIAPVAGGNTDLANAFIAYVLSDEGQQVLTAYGFSPVD